MVSSLLAALLLAVGVQAAELDGVQLELNGIGLRTRYFFKVYVAGLYLPQKVSSAQTALEGPGPKRIVLVMLRDASAEQFVDSIDAGLDANHTDAELEK